MNTKSPEFQSLDTSGLKREQISDAEIRLVKTKIKALLNHLISSHVADGGYYYESKKGSAGLPTKIILSQSQPAMITLLMMPYVVWVTARYLQKFYGHHYDFFEFEKVEALGSGLMELNFKPTKLAVNNLSIILMFIVVVFQDRFRSSDLNKVVINELVSIINPSEGVV